MLQRSKFLERSQRISANQWNMDEGGRIHVNDKIPRETTLSIPSNVSMALACSMLAPSAVQDSPRLGSLRDDPRFAELLATGRSVEATMSSLSVVEFSPSIEASCFLHRCRRTLNKLRTRSSDLSVIDRVTGRFANISSFKGCRGCGVLKISRFVPCATVRYMLRAG